MANPQLLDYIRQQLSVGATKVDIQKTLATQGWNDKDVGEAFSAIETKVSPVVAISVPAIPTLQSITAPVSGRKNKWFFVGSAVTILILLGAGIVFAAPSIKTLVLSKFQSTPPIPSDTTANTPVDQTTDSNINIQDPDSSGVTGDVSPTNSSSIPADSSFGYCPRFSQTLQPGAKDDGITNQVTQLQKFLADYYKMDRKTIVDGNYASSTNSYTLLLVKKFQTEQKLSVTGIVDQNTQVAISKECLSMQQKNRDLQRFVDLKNIRDMLLSYANAYKTFPASMSAALPKTPSQYAAIKKIPLDPLDKDSYIYHVTDEGRGFELEASLEQVDYAKANQKTLQQILAPNVAVSESSCTGEVNGRYCYSFSYKLNPNY